MSTLLSSLARLVHFAYWYCCDFMVNLGNLTHTTYNEANTWVLLLLIPLLLTVGCGVRAVQWWQLRRLRQLAKGGAFRQ